ncbi:MAG: sugar ABC transporter permease [Paenibacillaceae bacterium]|nr:sugar ABC transporter permease [Paenibacillaceae bacterium]
MPNLGYKRQRAVLLIAFLFPPLVFLALFGVYPALQLIRFSFTSWDGYMADKPWVGWDNYREVLSSPELFGIFGHNAIYLLWGLLQNATGLMFALLLNSRLRGRNIYRVILFLPYILNGTAVAFMFKYLYNTDIGSLNGLLSAIGFGDVSISWLGNPKLVNHSLGFVGLWKYTGFTMVVYLAALQSIPTDVTEAARMDGANRLQLLRWITLPGIVRIIELNLFLTIIGALEAFELPFLLTNGGPLGASETFVTHTIATAFKFSHFGLASAMSVVLIVLVVVVLALQRLFMRRWDE